VQLAGCNNAGAHSETHYHALKINFNPIRSGVESNIYRAVARVLSIEDARSRRSVCVVGAWLGWLHTLKRPGFNHNQQWRRRIFLSIYAFSILAKFIARAIQPEYAMLAARTTQLPLNN
jgi:hypothetical protein